MCLSFHVFRCGMAEQCPHCGCTLSLADAASCPACQRPIDEPPEATLGRAPERKPAAAPGREQPPDKELETGGAGRPEPLSPGPAVSAALSPATKRALWMEVGAVLAVGVVPNLIAALYHRVHPNPPASYWLTALTLTGNDGCTIFVTHYLIHRSGEPWQRFGLRRPGFLDVAGGLVLFLVLRYLWVFGCSLVTWDDVPSPFAPHPHPRQAVDYALMVLTFGVAGFAEELVTRAYLITRLEQLLQSRGAAVLLAAALFASYHAYYGIRGVANTLAMGVVYGVAYLLIRRVWPLAIGHALYNIRIDLIS